MIMIEKKIKRGVYLLPNLLTTFGLFAGFFSIILATKGQYAEAAIAIFVAMVWDGLDGRVARLTNTQSAFGEQYDSMADMVSFGVAPALLIYFWQLSEMGQIGWIGAFVYTAAGALRLARFNTQIGVDIATKIAIAASAYCPLVAKIMEKNPANNPNVVNRLGSK
jgi:CDP-diacylglycerol--serine O-phosphatidyltransferase